jgi:hypothetical protein
VPHEAAQGTTGSTREVKRSSSGVPDPKRVRGRLDTKSLAAAYPRTL